MLEIIAASELTPASDCAPMRSTNTHPRGNTPWTVSPIMSRCMSTTSISGVRGTMPFLRFYALYRRLKHPLDFLRAFGDIRGRRQPDVEPQHARQLGAAPVKAHAPAPPAAMRLRASSIASAAAVAS